MKNMNDVREKFEEFAEACIESSDELIQIMKDFDAITGGGVEVFELSGFSGVGYMVYREGDLGWTWKSYESGEDDIFWGFYGTRAEAMIAAATDADLTVYDYVDPFIGSRIRNAI